MITGQIDSGRAAPGKTFGGAGAGSPASPEEREAMRFLVVGAGATGGYFGGRLLEAGRDVTFLVRPARAERLAATGLTIASPAGDVTLRSPPTALAPQLRTPFDAVILSCKAYDLDGAIESFAPAVGPDT